MAKQKYADVEIVTPGTFTGSSIIVNGLDLSRFCTGMKIDLDANENNLAIIHLSMIANIRITGEALIETEHEPD